MRKFPKFLFLFLLFAGIFQMNSFSQDSKDTSRILKNTIRMNITNPMIFGESNILLGYERVLTDHQSISVNTGLFALPKFKNVDTDSLALKNGFKDKGFSFATDYRFYLKKENRFNAPRGVYIGPYYTYNYFQRENAWSLNTQGIVGDVNTTIRLNAHLVGAEMGYQFVIRRRLSVDLILFGPGVWLYKVKTSFSTDLSEEDEAMVIGKINEILAEKLPGNEILIKPGEKTTKNSMTTASLGFRYVINIGFRF